MMRVCMLVTNRGYDDPRVCMEARALAAGGHQVTVLGWDREVDADYRRQQDGVEFHCLQLRSTHGAGLKQVLFLGRFWWRMQAVLRAMRPAVIHCHDLDTVPGGYVAARRLKAKLVFDAHENFPDMMDGHLPCMAVRALRRLEAWFVPRCDLLISVGQRLVEYYRNLGARQVILVGNWKDRQAYEFTADQVAQSRQELGVPPNTIVIGFVGNLGRERCVEPLLAAVAADPRFSCIIGGGGAQEDLVRQYVQRAPTIIYLGRVAPARVPLITAVCDVVYYGFDQDNPNAYWSAPNKLYEAIAAGKALLASDVGEIGQTIKDERCGLLLTTATAETIGQALKALASREELGAMAQRAQALQTRFSAQQAAETLRQAYASWAAEGRTA